MPIVRGPDSGGAWPPGPLREIGEWKMELKLALAWDNSFSEFTIN